MSCLEDLFELQIRSLSQKACLFAPTREYRFAAQQVGDGKGLRKRLAVAGLKDWRFDFAWPEYKFAVEIEGGAWINGRHNRGAGFEADLQKYHHAMRLGWDVYRCGAQLVRNGESAILVHKLLVDKSNLIEPTNSMIMRK